MKNLNIVIFIASILILGCEGPPGPVGLPGRDGIDGVNAEESFVFEYELSFSAPEYSALLNLPEDFTMLDSDVLLVYFLWEVNDGLEIWRALPQALYFEDGILNYNFDFTKFDASVFLDGTVNLDGLGADYTDNWIARIVVVPAQFADARTALDYTDYDEVKEFYDLSPSKLATEEYTKRPEW